MYIKGNSFEVQNSTHCDVIESNITATLCYRPTVLFRHLPVVTLSNRHEFIGFY
jgi:hypothetical protein